MECHFIHRKVSKKEKTVIDKIIELSLLSGGLLPMMALLLLLTLTIIIERTYFFYHVTSFGSSLERDLKLVTSNDQEKWRELESHYRKTLQISIVSAAISATSRKEESIKRVMEEAILWQIPKLERNIWVLDTSVTLAPLMGLLGTIIGMVHAFDILGVSGAGGASTQMISGGIAEALVATGAGIFIAILAVVFLNHFNKKVGNILHQMELLKVMTLNRLVP